MAAWTVITWINASSIAPLHNWHYEFFVVQHIVTFIGLIVAIMMHIPVMHGRVYVYIPTGISVFSHIVRGIWFLYFDSRGGRATITALPGNVSKVQVESTRLLYWSPGQRLFLSLPQFGLFQSPPATIISTLKSHSGDLVLIFKAQRRFTQRLPRSADSSTASLPSTTEKSASASSSEVEEAGEPRKKKYLALVSSPYGNSHLDFAAFSTIILISGSTGITFNLAMLLDIAEHAPNRFRLRSIYFT